MWHNAWRSLLWCHAIFWCLYELQLLLVPYIQHYISNLFTPLSHSQTSTEATERITVQSISRQLKLGLLHTRKGVIEHKGANLGETWMGENQSNCYFCLLSSILNIWNQIKLFIFLTPSSHQKGTQSTCLPSPGIISHCKHMLKAHSSYF